MSDRGPWTGHLTKAAQKRFDLQWVLPLEPGLATHAALVDLQCDPPHDVAIGQGGDENEALLDLWTTLTDRAESPDPIAFVAQAYQRRTRQLPGDT
jgi:hypothetical protein